MSMIMSPTGSCNNGGGGGGGGQFGDTTYTKVFVGGLAWETQKETMKKYFEQFGDILEAVVITDKATGRSKGYGFVTFREAEAAMRACVDAAPVIDGRRANCNLASLGVQKSKPSTPKHQQHAGGGGRNFRIMSSFQTGGVGGFGGAAGFHSATFPHYAIQQPPALPYNLYGYSPYSADYTATYPTGYYSVYGGGSNQYQAVYGGGLMSSGGAGAAAAYYPYLQVGDVSGATTGYATSVTQGYGGALHHQYPHHHLFHQYSPLSSTTATTYAAPAPHHHYAPPISLAPSPALHTPVCFAVPQA